MNISQSNNSFSHTNHSIQRSQQRGVEDNDISYILQFAKPIYKQGFKFYSLKNKSKNKIPPQFKREALINLVVITSGDDKTIITVYKSSNAWKRVKRKHNYLS